MKTKHIFPTCLAVSALLAATSVQAATVFLTNNTSPKTLASNEGDAGVGLTNGTDNNGLHLDEAGDSTVLTLSADDGGGAITFTTINVSGGNNLFMDGDSMGHGNDKWGANQNWTFSLDQTISFDALSFKASLGAQTMTLKSAAWVGGTDTAGTGWSFDGTTGEFSISGAGDFDFTSAGVSDVAAGTSIGFGFFESTAGGIELSSFTITAIPEPTTALLGGLGFLALLRRRR